MGVNESKKEKAWESGRACAHLWSKIVVGVFLMMKIKGDKGPFSRLVACLYTHFATLRLPLPLRTLCLCGYPSEKQTIQEVMMQGGYNRQSCKAGKNDAKNEYENQLKNSDCAQSK